jgi:hypothetical protein
VTVRHFERGKLFPSFDNITKKVGHLWEKLQPRGIMIMYWWTQNDDGEDQH